MQKIFINKFLTFYPFIILSLTQFLYNFDSADVEVNFKFTKSNSANIGGLSDTDMFWIRVSDRIEGFLLIFISLNSDLDTKNTAGQKLNVSFTDDIFDNAGEKIFKSNIGTIRAYFIGKDPDAVNLDPLNDKLTEGTLSGILNEIAVYDKLTSRTYLSKREYDLVLMHALDQSIWNLFVDASDPENIAIKHKNSFEDIATDMNAMMKGKFNGGFKIISYNKPNIISNNFKIKLPFTPSVGTFSDENSGAVNGKALFKYVVIFEIAENAVYKFVHFDKDFARTESDMNKIDGADATKIEEELKKILGEV